MLAFSAVLRIQAEVEMVDKRKPYRLQFVITFMLILASDCYEKSISNHLTCALHNRHETEALYYYHSFTALRKIVRNQSKMVQTPFSTSNADFRLSNRSRHIPQQFMFPGYTHVKSVIHKMQRPKISTILSSIDTGRSKSMYSRMNMSKHDNTQPYELRIARDAIADVIRQSEDNFIFGDSESVSLSDDNDTDVKLSYAIPTSRFFTALDEPRQPDASKRYENSISIPENSIQDVKNNIFVNSVSDKNTTLNEKYDPNLTEDKSQKLNKSSYDVEIEKADFLIEEAPVIIESSFYNMTEMVSYICAALHQAKADIDAQEKFSHLDIEVGASSNLHFILFFNFVKVYD